MFSGMFQSNSIPVLEQVVAFTESRHLALAGNIANMDTPGYQARDLSVEAFQSDLRKAIDQQRRSPLVESPGQPSSMPTQRLAEVSKNPKSILLHDQSNVGMEYQAAEMVKNQMQHNLALSVMVQQFHLLQTAISGRV